jgi:MFS family permease
MARGPGKESKEASYSYMDLVRIQPFRRLWGGDLASQTSDRIAFVAITVLAYGEDASPMGLAAVIGAYFFPAIVLGVVGGVAADRWPRRTMMVMADGVRVILAIALAMVGSDIWILLALVLAFSSLTQFFYPARQAAIPSVVPKRALLPANAAISANLILGFAIGPALGGLSVALLDPRWGLIIAALVMALGVVIIASIREEGVRTSARDAGEGLGSVVRDGLTSLRGKRALLHGLVLVGFVMFAVGGGAVGLVIFADAHLDLGEEGFSILLSALAVGTLVGAVAAGGRSPEKPKGRVVVTAVLFAGALLVVLSLVDDISLALGIMFTIGIACAMVLVPFTTMLHERMGDHVMGTTFGVLNTALSLPMVAGVIAAGPIIDAAGELRLFQGLGVLLIAVGITTLFMSRLWNEDA